MDFFIKYLSETVEAINKMGNGTITVKKIRTFQDIKSSNRSRINFIWRSLAYLAEKGILEENGSQHLKSYKRKTIELNLENIIVQAKKDRILLNRSNLNGFNLSK